MGLEGLNVGELEMDLVGMEDEFVEGYVGEFNLIGFLL